MADLLHPRIDGPRRLRELLSGAEPVLAPGAYDAMSARLVQAAGFPAVYMTGFGASASLLGRPDVGLLTMSEMVDAARRMTSLVTVPLIADADTGYGSPINVMRTVREYESAGVAAIHIEDQASPKRCGHLDGKHLVPAEDMAQKVRAAVQARSDPDLVLIARTDARAVEGVDAAVERARRYRDAGADMLFVEALQSVDEIVHVAGALRGIPLLFNWAEGGKTPPMEIARLHELGFRVVIFPISTLLSATTAVRETLAEIAASGTPQRALPRMPAFAEFLDLVGLPEIQDLGRRFDPTPP
jgi:carboxyvinyl-carboxyphosphonate phosphorylmutase